MLEISLYENIIDSICHGVEHLSQARNNNSIIDYKHGLLAIFQGTELLLKQLLCLKNPIYMFDKNSLFDKCKDPMNPKLNELYNCKSLEINKLCSEVKKNYKGYFTYYDKNDSKNKNGIDLVPALAKERNKIQHFAINFDEDNLFEMICKINNHVILPSINIISHKISESKILIDNSSINKKLIDLFNLFEIATQQEKILILQNKIFDRTVCPQCGVYSRFIIFDDRGSYPQEYICTSCGNKKNNLLIENFYECPECNINSLYYIEEIDAGICLNSRCDFCREGDEVEVVWCDKCKSYSIEGICNCNIAD